MPYNINHTSKGLPRGKKCWNENQRKVPGIYYRDSYTVITIENVILAFKMCTKLDINKGPIVIDLNVCSVYQTINFNILHLNLTGLI